MWLIKTWAILTDHALFSHHQRIFPLKQIGTNPETVRQTLYREWEILGSWALKGMSLPAPPLPSGFTEPWEKWGRKSVRGGGDGGHQENKAVCTQSPRQTERGLPRSAPGLLGTDHGFQLSVFYGTLGCSNEWVYDSYAVFLLFICLVQLQCDRFVLSHCTALC